MSIESVITENLDIWTSAIKTKSASGRGSSNKLELYGIKKLRELILELAIRGKLVAQDSSEEPANELLKTIELNKLKLVKDKKIRKPKALPAIEETELPFPVPSSWSYVRLNSIGDWGSGSTPKRSISEYYGGDIPWFKSGELSADYIDASEETVTEKALEETSLRYNNIGDVLIAMYGATIGKTSILNVRGTTNQAVCACTPFQGVVNTYLLLLLKAYKTRFIGMGAGGAQPNISREKIISTVVPLPPLNEQKRIVAKVNKLMKLCDQLESQTESSIEAHKTLVGTLLTTLTNAKDADELNERWQRISEHFDSLFTTEDSIDQLKQTILQLAVMGKLVKQDPNDEPASALLARIAEEKEQLIKDKKIKKQKALPTISEVEKSFTIPLTWSWERLGVVCKKLTDGSHNPPPNNGNGFPMLSCKEINNGEIDFTSATRFVNKEGYDKEHKRTAIKAGDILLNIVASIGRTAVVPQKHPKFVLQRNVAVIDSELDENYLAMLLTSPLSLSYYEKHAKGTAQKVIYLGKLSLLPLPIPPLGEQVKIVEKVRCLFGLCDELSAKLSTAASNSCQLADCLLTSESN